ncbi:hypothetical protein TPHA_0E02270 [Tetrapisispora phaffii CBS 4417]|uniref:Protein kinase domain-containing protein n=1 Tax=Tetrapisispora phaffii (strain ATCC 24235 / CBS 4417 / NBRC 1672 / NRRL Y-8282 / UCD 70-5) TaxID=1071381 RepID=G8BTU1_TETPH|nr:hypothetical protein TPHA_0E02270 [Tetrapisispora phaffii CBS 4417]CCE63319.1 hypothetical protein TPHA_0E02270 [Tetrapisispora phaffii CBS 4417]
MEEVNKTKNGKHRTERRKAYTAHGEQMLISENFDIFKIIHNNHHSTIALSNFANAVVEKTNVTIKKFKTMSSTKNETEILKNYKRIVREVKLLNFLKFSSNIIQLYDIDVICTNDIQIPMDVYLYEEAMESDLDKIIKSNQHLSDLHYQNFLNQLLSAVKYLHSAGIIHGDIKPSNVLVNSDCQIKLTGFSYSVSTETKITSNDTIKSNDSQSSKWYRAPELILNYNEVSEASDVWSIGCVLAELFSKRAFLKSKDYLGQLNRLLQILGTPPQSVLSKIKSSSVKDYINRLGIIPRVRFNKFFSNINFISIDMLEKMLQYDTTERITIDDALNHTYLKIWHEPKDEFVSKEKFSFEFENITSLTELCQLIIREVDDDSTSMDENGNIQYAEKPTLQDTDSSEEWIT